MKKLVLFAMMAMVALFTQCKKEEPATNTDNSISVTVSASTGGGAGKTEVYGNQFGWTYDQAEYLYVGGSLSGYLGYLSGTKTTGTGNESLLSFSGNLSEPADGETLYFYYLGKGGKKSLTNGAETTAINFQGQDGIQSNAMAFHIAISEGKEYRTGDTDFNTVTLYTKTSFARFNLEGFNNEMVNLHGDDIYSSVNINFKEGTITPTEQNHIQIGNSSDVVVALVPVPNSVGQPITLEFESANYHGEFEFSDGIQENTLYGAGNGGLTSGGLTVTPASGN